MRPQEDLRWGAGAALLHVVRGSEAGLFLEELDEVATAAVAHALTDALDGVVAVVGGVVHAATCFTNAVVCHQGGESPALLLIDGL